MESFHCHVLQVCWPRECPSLVPRHRSKEPVREAGASFGARAWMCPWPGEAPEPPPSCPGYNAGPPALLFCKAPDCILRAFCQALSGARAQGPPHTSEALSEGSRALPKTRRGNFWQGSWNVGKSHVPPPPHLKTPSDATGGMQLWEVRASAASFTCWAQEPITEWLGFAPVIFAPSPPQGTPCNLCSHTGCSRRCISPTGSYHRSIFELGFALRDGFPAGLTFARNGKLSQAVGLGCLDSSCLELKLHCAEVQAGSTKMVFWNHLCLKKKNWQQKFQLAQHPGILCWFVFVLLQVS